MNFINIERSDIINAHINYEKLEEKVNMLKIFFNRDWRKKSYISSSSMRSCHMCKSYIKKKSKRFEHNIYIHVHFSELILYT